jgi:hypothetical protein
MKQYEPNCIVETWNRTKLEETSFYTQNKVVLDERECGDGYWLWKPYIINNALRCHKLPIIYMDVGRNEGNEILQHPGNLIRSLYYFRGICVSETRDTVPIAQLTSDKCLKSFKSFESYFTRTIIETGFMIVDQSARSLIHNWLTECQVVGNLIGSRDDHRHDSSIFSILFHAFEYRPNNSLHLYRRKG